MSRLLIMDAPASFGLDRLKQAKALAAEKATMLRRKASLVVFPASRFWS